MTIVYPPPLQMAMSSRRKIFADAMWRDFGSFNLDGFRPAKQGQDFEGPCISVTRETLLSETPAPRELQPLDKNGWNAWKTADVPAIQSDGATLPDPLSLLMFPRCKSSDRTGLSSIPTTNDIFVDILTSLHIPGIFLDYVIRPRGVFKCLKTSVNNQPCQIFILSVDSILQNHTAMCVTYFPESRQVYALYLGYSSKQDVSDMTSRLVKNKNHTNNPFVLIAAFLEIERRNRIKQVDAIVNIYSEKLRPEPVLSKRRTLSSPDSDGSRTSESSQSFNSRLGTLKMQLKIWTLQLKKLAASCDKFPELKPGSTAGFLLDPHDYVNEMIEWYEESIIKCDNILQVMSLAFQKDLADAAREDARVAISDASQMKAIAILTMFFLPATAISGFMDAPIYEWGDKGKYWFWPMVVIITSFVLGSYVCWIRFVRRRRDYVGSMV